MVLTKPWPYDELSPERRDYFAHYITLYKEIKCEWFYTCQVYHHDPIRAHEVRYDWLAIEYVVPSRDRELAGVMRLEGAIGTAYTFRPRDLRLERPDKVTSDNHRAAFSVSSIDLHQTGLCTELETTFAPELYLFDQR